MSKWILSILLLGMGAGVMAEEMVRTVTVSGTGYAEAEPDHATLTMSVVARNKELSAAQNEAADVTRKVLELADRMNIRRDRVDTTGASVRPDYRWNSQREEQELRGYIAERQITIYISDLEKLGTVIEGVVEAGVNDVSQPVLESSDKKEAYLLALRNAAKDARENAIELTETLGARLGDVVSINASSNFSGPPVAYEGGMRMMAAAAPDNAETYNAADLKFSASVNVIFEILQ